MTATLRRRVANALVRQVSKTLPSARAPWAEAMRQEVSNIKDDQEALKWALGCFHAGVSETLRTTRLLDLSLVRWGIAFWTATQMFSDYFDACIVFAMKFHH